MSGSSHPPFLGVCFTNSLAKSFAEKGSVHILIEGWVSVMNLETILDDHL